MRPRAGLLALVAWVRAAAGRVGEWFDTPPQASRSRSLSEMERGQSDASTTVKAGAGVVGAVGLTGLVKQYVIGGPLYGLSIEITELIGSIGGFLSPVTAFVDGIASTITSSMPDGIIARGAQVSAGSLDTFGFLAYPVGLAIGLGGLYLFITFFQRFDVSPLKTIYGRFR